MNEEDPGSNPGQPTRHGATAFCCVVSQTTGVAFITRGVRQSVMAFTESEVIVIVMRKFQDTKAHECRWSELFEELIGDWLVIWEESEVDYQGHARVMAFKDGRLCYAEWFYGSCSGCDPWEDMPHQEALVEASRDVMFFKDATAAWTWIGMLLEASDWKGTELMAAMATLSASGGNPAV